MHADLSIVSVVVPCLFVFAGFLFFFAVVVFFSQTSGLNANFFSVRQVV